MKLLTKIKNSLLVNIPLIFFIASFIVYFLTSAGETPYDYFTRLAFAFKNGRFWLTENPPWLSELVPVGDKYFVIHPPLVSVIMVPLLLLGISVQQELFSFFVGATFVYVSVKLALALSKSREVAIWIGILAAFGNIMWFMTSQGSSWYLGQTTAALFLLAAVYESQTNKRPLLTGLLVGAAYMSRIQTILAVPFFLFNIGLHKNKKGLAFFFIGILFFFTANSLYNFARFGVIWDKAYLLMPGVLDEPWFQSGYFHPSYIARHLKILFGKLPVIGNEIPFIWPSWEGLAIWLTTPAFMYSLKAKLKKTEVLLAWGSIFAIALVVFMHGTTGFAQFGYRYAVDFYPFLIFLTILGVKRTGLTKIHWILIIIGVIVNLWGVLWINKFGWVSY